MTELEARNLIANAVGKPGRFWADVGAGAGTFTRALRSLLPHDARIYAIDSNPDAVAELASLGGNVTAIQGDFTRPIILPDENSLDGLLFANALHFVSDAAGVLRHLVQLVRPGGRVVIVEYDRRAANPWVPFPIQSERWPALAAESGLVDARIVARTASKYAGELYVGAADRALV